MLLELFSIFFGDFHNVFLYSIAIFVRIRVEFSNRLMWEGWFSFVLFYVTYSFKFFSRWVHIVCALYIPGVAFGDTARLTGITLFEMPYDKWGAKVCQNLN